MSAEAEETEEETLFGKEAQTICQPVRLLGAPLASWLLCPGESRVFFEGCGGVGGVMFQNDSDLEGFGESWSSCIRKVLSGHLERKCDRVVRLAQGIISRDEYNTLCRSSHANRS